VFRDAESLVEYFASAGVDTLLAVARPDLQLVRGLDIPASVLDAIRSKGIPAVFGKHVFGFVKNDYRQPDYTSKTTTGSLTTHLQLMSRPNGHASPMPLLS
jgi:reverse gyrase